MFNRNYATIYMKRNWWLHRSSSAIVT